MKLNKTFALVALVAGSLFAANALQAQDSTNTPPAGEHHGGPGMRQRPNMDQMVDKMAKELNLTDDQKTKVKAAMEEQVTKMKAVHDDTNLTPEDKRAKMKDIHDGYIAKMKTILTPEQFEKWQKHMMQRPHPPKGGANQPPAGGENEQK
jgi:Spy/CpxP family protein refolding chaperone